MSRRTYGANAFSTNISGTITAGSTSIPLNTVAGLTAPGYLVIDPFSGSKREVIKFESVNGGTSAVETLTRGLTGSAAGAQGHTDSLVIATFTEQALSELFTDIEDLETADTNHAAAADPHTAYILTDGTRAFTAAVAGVAGTGADLATKDQVDSLISSAVAAVPDNPPVGAIMQWLGTSEPSGWLFLNGQAISRTSFPVLFAEYGTTYGVGDGSTTFNLPDMQGRFPLGKTASGTGATLGGTGGTLDATINIEHQHGMDHTHLDNFSIDNAGTHSHTTPPHNHSFTHTHTNPTTGSVNAGGTAIGAENGGSTFEYAISSHTHNQGSTTGQSTSTTGNASPTTNDAGDHSHGLTGSVTATSGETTDLAGTTALPVPNSPFMAMNFIVRAG